MARIELTIASDYVPRWGLWEGFREVVANGSDARREYNAPLTVDYADGRIKVKNTGCTLTSKALLLGASTKAGRGDLIGTWGEGLKLALLALTRAGYKVKVRSGAEVWVPRLVKSERFDGATILVVDVAKGREFQNRVQVEIEKVSLEQWTELRSNVLWLDTKTMHGFDDFDQGDAERVIKAGDYGQILLEPRHRGRIYASGIYVQTVTDYDHGYNFTVKVEMDRDRKMVEEWNRQSTVSRMWCKASQENTVAMEQALRLLASGSREVENVQHLVGYHAPAKAVASAAAKAFKTKYGDDAVPVANLEQAKDVEHLGVRGVVVTEAHRAVLKVTIGDMESVKTRLREQVTRRYSWSDLDTTQRKNLSEALDLIALADVKVTLADVDVVDFRDSNLLGQYKVDEGRILLAAKVVSEWSECLRVIIHEAAHAAGGDGDKGHIRTIEHTWARLISALWR